MRPRKSNEKLESANSLEKNNSRLPTRAHSVPTSVNDSKPDSPQSHLPDVEIHFAELEGGSLAEMVEDPADPTRSVLAVYKDGIVHYAERWLDRNRILVPISRTDLLLKHVRLPQGAEPYDGLDEVIKDVSSFFIFCLDVDSASVALMTAYVFSTWFPDKLSVAPYLALLGPPGSGKTTALRVLSLLCRRSLLTADITSAAFYDICHRIGPTILIDETRSAGQPRRLFHLLRSSSSRGLVALSSEKAQLAYGPKVLSWVELPDDPQLNSRCVIIPMHKTSRTDLNSPDDPRVLQYAEKVRMRLLQFRFEHYRKLPVPKAPLQAQLSSRALDLYRALALPFGSDQKFCELLASLIGAQRRFQPSLLSPAQASVVRVLHAFIHKYPASPGFMLSDLTTAMSLDLASRCEPSGLNERKVGYILTSLGLTNRSRKSNGYALWLNRSDRVRIHEMPRDYEVDGVPTEPIQTCEICTKKEHGADESSAEAVNQKQARPDVAKRERRERRLRRNTRSAVRSLNRSH
jgi:hypothetical protein